MEDLGPNALIYALLLILPVSALIGRRVPFLRVVSMLLTWAALFGVATYVFTQRERFDPYLARIASALNISDQKVVGKEVRIRMSADGHFWAQVAIGGSSKRLLIDSGATVTALSAKVADEFGLEVKAPVFPLVIETANGQVSAKSATVAELRLGNIVARDLAVVVSPAFGDTNVLGMNFLSRLKSWRVEGKTLILTPHHPRDLT